MEPTREQVYRRRIAELEAEVTALKSEVARLAALVAKLSKNYSNYSYYSYYSYYSNSSNYSKPPSSDIVKAPQSTSSKRADSRKEKRKIGGQPGHRKHERPSFSSDEIDGVREYRLNCCPDCSGPVSHHPKEARIVQQVELAEKPVEIVEHRAVDCWCRRCKKVFHAPLPAAVQKGGLLRPELTALAGYLKGVCHASFSTIRKYFREVLHLPISRGQLAKVIGKVSAGIGPAYEELRASLPDQRRLNVDKTGHRNNGKPHWTWCFRAELYTLLDRFLTQFERVG